MAATTEETAAMATTAAITKPRKSATAGPDRLSVVMFTLAGLLAILALLASQFTPASSRRARPLVVLRRVYEKRVVETLVGPPGGRSEITRSVASSGSAYPAPAAPTTRAS